jgi:hypothetical protein
MASILNPNIHILERAVNLLGSLADEMVFLGGCATGLLITDPAAPPIRVSQDVDVIIELASLTDYYLLSEKLRKRGFREDQSTEAPICRWIGPGVVLDTMPTKQGILGFGNEWYQRALNAASKIRLPSGRSIRMVTAPYFLATKLAAFDSRGKGDFMMSHDMEDIIAVIDGRPEVVNDLSQAETRVRQYLSKRFGELIENPDFLATVPGHLQGGITSPDRTPVILERIKAIVAAV